MPLQGQRFFSETQRRSFAESEAKGKVRRRRRGSSTSDSTRPRAPERAGFSRTAGAYSDVLRPRYPWGVARQSGHRGKRRRAVRRVGRATRRSRLIADWRSARTRGHPFNRRTARDRVASARAVPQKGSLRAFASSSSCVVDLDHQRERRIERVIMRTAVEQDIPLPRENDCRRLRTFARARDLDDARVGEERRVRFRRVLRCAVESDERSHGADERARNRLAHEIHPCLGPRVGALQGESEPILASRHRYEKIAPMSRAPVRPESAAKGFLASRGASARGARRGARLVDGREGMRSLGVPGPTC
jgi:hypothetical protein